MTPEHAVLQPQPATRPPPPPTAQLVEAKIEPRPLWASKNLAAEKLRSWPFGRGAVRRRDGRAMSTTLALFSCVPASCCSLDRRPPHDPRTIISRPDAAGGELEARDRRSRASQKRDGSTSCLLAAAREGPRSPPDEASSSTRSRRATLPRPNRRSPRRSLRQLSTSAPPRVWSSFPAARLARDERGQPMSSAVASPSADLVGFLAREESAPARRPHPTASTRRLFSGSARGEPTFRAMCGKSPWSG